MEREMGRECLERVEVRYMEGNIRVKTRIKEYRGGKKGVDIKGERLSVEFIFFR